MKTPKHKDKDFFREFPCPVETIYKVIGGKWRTRVIWEIGTSKQPIRFNELRERLAPVSRKVLSNQLRELEEMNFIVRREFQEFPPRVEYTLSDFGESLSPFFASAVRWLEKNQLPVREIIKDRPHKNG